jgi:hypothetical protein
MAMKQKGFDLTTKLEIICMWEVSSSSKCKTREQDVLTLTLLMILKRTQYIPNSNKQGSFSCDMKS